MVLPDFYACLLPCFAKNRAAGFRRQPIYSILKSPAWLPRLVYFSLFLYICQLSLQFTAFYPESAAFELEMDSIFCEKNEFRQG